MAQSVQSRERESTEGAGQNQLRPCLEISGDGVNSLVNRPLWKVGFMMCRYPTSPQDWKAVIALHSVLIYHVRRNPLDMESRGEQETGDAERSGGHQRKAGDGRAWERNSCQVTRDPQHLTVSSSSK